MAPPKKQKQLAKVVHMHAGVELIGSRTSMAYKPGKNELEVTALGVKAWSKETNRTVLVPWANIRGCELMPMADESNE